MAKEHHHVWLNMNYNALWAILYVDNLYVDNLYEETQIQGSGLHTSISRIMWHQNYTVVFHTIFSLDTAKQAWYIIQRMKGICLPLCVHVCREHYRYSKFCECFGLVQHWMEG